MNYLTSLRGIAALLVVLFHTKHHIAESEWLSFLYPVVSNGYLAVDFFFLLSGFILAFKYHKEFSEHPQQGYTAFIIKRLARIYPLHFFVMLGYLGVPAAIYVLKGHAGTFTFDSYIVKLFLIDLWLINHQYWQTWNVPSWTISGELFAYMLFPIAIFLIQKLPVYVRLISPLIIFSILAASYGYFDYDSIGEGIGRLGLIRCLSQFSVGIFIYFIWQEFGTKFSLTVASVFFPLILVGSWFYSLPNYCYVPAAFALLLLMSISTNSYLHSILNTRPLVYLGDISYSVYLTHALIGEFFFRIMLENDEHANELLLISYTGIVILTSAITHKLVENYFRRKIIEKFISKESIIRK